MISTAASIELRDAILQALEDNNDRLPPEFLSGGDLRLRLFKKLRVSVKDGNQALKKIFQDLALEPEDGSEVGHGVEWVKTVTNSSRPSARQTAQLNTPSPSGKSVTSATTARSGMSYTQKMKRKFGDAIEFEDQEHHVELGSGAKRRLVSVLKCAIPLYPTSIQPELRKVTNNSNKSQKIIDLYYGHYKEQKARIEKTLTSIGSTQLRQQELESKIQHLESQKSTSLEDISTANEDIRRLKGELSDASKSFNNLEHEHDQLQRQLKEQQAAFDSNTGEKSGLIADLESNLQDAADLAMTLQAENEQERRRLQADVLDREKQIDQVHQRARDLEEESKVNLEQSRRKILELEETLSSLTTRIEELKRLQSTEGISNQAINNDYEQRIRSLQHRLDATTQDLNNSQQSKLLEGEEARLKLSQASDLRSSLQNQLSTQYALVNQLNEDLKNVRAQYSEHQNSPPPTPITTVYVRDNMTTLLRHIYENETTRRMLKQAAASQERMLRSEAAQKGVHTRKCTDITCTKSGCIRKRLKLPTGPQLSIRQTRQAH